MSKKLRKIKITVKGRNTSDGAGVRLRRMIGTAELDNLNPFLLLDEFKSDNKDDYIAGFPTHPHRGFETVTYMLAGVMKHGDSTGASGILKPGGAQWMTAGRGILHSEMPQQEDGLLWGFQLWVNLPAKSKMREPRYQDIEPQQIPEVTTQSGAKVRVVAGIVDETEGPALDIETNPLYIDVTLAPSSSFTQNIDPEHVAFAYVFDGAVVIDGQVVEAGNLAVFDKGDFVRISAGEISGRFLLLSAMALDEPVVRYGPFVMSTQQELETAFEDYRNGKIGAV